MLDEGGMTWQTVRAWATNELQRRREVLEKKDCSVQQGDVARGAIDGLKELLRLPEQLRREAEQARQTKELIE